MRKKKSYTDGTFGPVVIHEGGTFRASCAYCIFRAGYGPNNICRHVKPSRTIENPEDTPDFCEMKAGMLRDAQAAEVSARKELRK